MTAHGEAMIGERKSDEQSPDLGAVFPIPGASGRAPRKAVQSMPV